MVYINTRFLNLDALRRQRQGKESAVSDDAKVGGCPDGNTRVVVRRVFDRIGIEPLGAELEHGGHCGFGFVLVGRRRRGGEGSASKAHLSSRAGLEMKMGQYAGIEVIVICPMEGK